MRTDSSPRESTEAVDNVIALIAALIVVVLISFGILSSFGMSAKALSRSHNGFGCSSPVRVESPIGFAADAVPPYSGNPSVEVNGNTPFFTPADFTDTPFETYSDLDGLGRCGTAFALVGPETMPKDARGSIGMIKPSGWHIAEYDWVDGRFLYNRCHLIAFSLAGENDNQLNLITGTRSMNVAGMLPYEEYVASFIDLTGYHVLYRVTPVFQGNNLVASGVLMEAESLEDGGEGICFCVWCYNVEPGVTIDYATGDSWASSGSFVSSGAEASNETQTAEPGKGYILNTKTRRFHRSECPSVADMNAKNKQAFDGSREEALQEGYAPCGICKP